MSESIRHVAVVGLMGAGKSTVGRALARRFGWAFRDSDTDIEAATGRTVRELGEEIGVEAMHKVEADQLLAALADPARTVIAAAASAIDDEACRRRLAEPAVVVLWLRGEPATLAARFASSPHRPAYGADPAVFLAEQAARRYPLYGALHPVVVDIDGRPPGAVVAAALEGLAQAGLSGTPEVARGRPGRVRDPESERPTHPGRMDLPARDRGV